MGLFKAFSGAISGTFADQWKNIIVPGPFDEHTAVVPGLLQNVNNGRGTNNRGSNGIISNGSKLFIPENTAAFIFSQGGIEEVVTEPGGYTYENGTSTVFHGDGVANSVIKETARRFAYGGIPSEQKKVAFINLREIRDIRFGTRGAQVYNDLYYGTDLEVFAYGTFSVKVTDPYVFVRNFVPANFLYYSFDQPRARAQILSEVVQSLVTALNALSATYRISQLPSQSAELAKGIVQDKQNVGSWPERFGLSIVRVALENIELTAESKELIRQFSENRMKLKAYEGISSEAASIAAQQSIAEGIKGHGFGNAAGALFAVNYAQSFMPGREEKKEAPPKEDPFLTLRKYKELLDEGILTQEEFDKKKRELLGI